MLFPTGEFLLLYLPLTLAGFFLIARTGGPRLAAAWLVLASVVFYASWRLDHVLVLGASIVFNYVAGGWILSAASAGQRQTARTRLVLALTVNLGALAYYKYANFFLDTLGGLGVQGVPSVSVGLPLGISFFTFTQIAYLVDVYAGRAVERSPVNYALFVTYFPHLVAGPVLHHAQMMPQFNEPRVYRPSLDSFGIGMGFLFIGMIKKVLVADSFAPVANEVFDRAGAGPVGTAEAWSGVLAYTNQIYFDFSGYSDMAVGLAMLIGVRLPFNFNSPYKSTSIIDFWRRWHITLSSFLRDYLYIALGGNRRGKARRYVNLLLTMVLGGLWHGASWTFVVWGTLHGLYLMANHGWRWLLQQVPGWNPAARPALAGVGAALGSVLTLLCVVVAWVFFRAPEFHTAFDLLDAMAGSGGAPATRMLPSFDALAWIGLSLLFLAVARWLPNSQQIIQRARERYARSPMPSALALASGVLVAAVLLLAVISESRNVAEFIYFNF